MELTEGTGDRSRPEDARLGHQAGQTGEMIKHREHLDRRDRGVPPGWTTGHGPAACHKCQRPASTRDPLGMARHPECLNERGAQ